MTFLRPGAIDRQRAAEVAEFARQRGVTHPVLVDDRSAGVAYRVVTIPHSVLIDPGGCVVGTFHAAVTVWGVKDALRELGNEPSRY